MAVAGRFNLCGATCAKTMWPRIHRVLCNSGSGARPPDCDHPQRFLATSPPEGKTGKLRSLFHDGVPAIAYSHIIFTRSRSVPMSSSWTRMSMWRHMPFWEHLCGSSAATALPPIPVCNSFSVLLWEAFTE